EIDALVADVDAGPGNQLLDLPLRFSAEGTEKLFVSVSRSRHVVSRFSRKSPALLGPGSVAVDDDVVDDAVLLGFLRAHEVVAFHVFRDFLELLSRVPGHDLLEAALEGDRLPGVDFDVRGLPLKAAPDLVDED